MNRLSVALSCILVQYALALTLSAQDLIRQSRENCVLIQSTSTKSAGTGFFLDDQHVATCFHVIAKLLDGGKWDLHPDL